jgi:hypothetical protein
VDTAMMPGTMPPNLKRKPFDLSTLPPEMQQAIMSNGQITLEDGSAIYADGTATGAGDSPDDFGFGMPNAGAMNVSYGGYGGGEGMAPGTMPEAPMAEEPRNPLGGPMFQRYRQTAKAPMPGTPGGLGGAPAEEGNPMEEAFPNPFETPEPARSVSVPGGASVIGGSPQAATTPGGSYTQADDPLKKKSPTYGGRFGRRQASRTMPSRRR